MATTDAAKAKAFYGDVLGLELVDETPFALVFDVAGTTLRVTPVQRVEAAPYTVLGWTVDDIVSAVADLKSRGVTLSRYEGMDHDDDGIWTSPSSARIAWFTDPDGNTLSITQLAG
ncbi:MAG: VOC family protein [Candidatus Dormibacteraeota bacterium]|nr:VOC family protein [Candidatus Dormibacteraeota bacterium]